MISAELNPKIRLKKRFLFAPEIKVKYNFYSIFLMVSCQTYTDTNIDRHRLTHTLIDIYWHAHIHIDIHLARLRET